MRPELPELTATCLEFTAEAQTPIELWYWSGSAIRGALLSALRRHYCPAPDDPDPGHSAVCPVCWLIAREDPEWPWGRTPARPYTIEVVGGQGRPLDGRNQTRFDPGDAFTFGVTLYGPAANLLPYLILGVPMMGQIGIGRRLRENDGRRGQFVLRSIVAYNPLTDERQTVLGAGSATVETPAVVVNSAQVAARAEQLADRVSDREGRLTLHFDTPTRIIDRGQLVKEPQFRPVFQRALDRVEGVLQQYGNAEPNWDVLPLLEAAERVRRVDADSRWVELTSGSRRSGRSTPVSGFIGYATFSTDDWTPFLPILIWATVMHVGKNTVKGKGMLRATV